MNKLDSLGMIENSVKVVDHDYREIMRHFSVIMIEKIIKEESFFNAFEEAKREIEKSLLNSDSIEFKWIEDKEDENKNA